MRGGTSPGWTRGGGGALLLAGVVLLFGLIGLWRVHAILFRPYAYPYPGMNDYEVYHHRAVDVLEHGLAMPSAPVPYNLPAGFLYIYFVALCYRILGVHPPYVFVVQSALVGVSVVLLFLAFRRGLAALPAGVLLASLAVFAFLDVQRYYAVQLFSENLILLEVAAFLWLARAAVVDGRPAARVLALGVLGLMPLTRPNTVLFVPVALAWLAWRARGGRVARDLALGTALLVVASSGMALRNHAAGGGWVAFPATDWRALTLPGYGRGLAGAEAVLGAVERRQGAVPVLRLAGHALVADPAGFARHYARRLLFVAGFVPVLDPAYRYRPHWMLLWAVFATALAWRLVRGPRPGPMVEVLLLWLACYLGPLVAVAQIQNYGFRFLLAGVVPAVAGAVSLVWPPGSDGEAPGTPGAAAGGAPGAGRALSATA